MHKQVVSLDEFGARLAVLLDGYAGNAGDVCEQAGVSDSVLSSWRHGRAEGAWRGVASVALVLGKTPNDLMLKDASSANSPKALRPEDQAARIKIMEILDAFEAAGKGTSEIVAQFLLGVAMRVLEDKSIPSGTVIHKTVEGVKLYDAPQVVQKIKGRGRKGGASQAGEGEGKYGKKKPRA